MELIQSGSPESAAVGQTEIEIPWRIHQGCLRGEIAAEVLVRGEPCSCSEIQALGYLHLVLDIACEGIGAVVYVSA